MKILYLSTLFIYTSIGLQASTILDQSIQRAPVAATVRQGSSLCGEEIKALYQRFDKTKNRLSSLLGKRISSQHVPFTAIAGSGGSHRAMVCTLGLLDALDQTGILDAVHYMGGVSGSTWTMASWLAHDCSLSNLKSFLRARVTSNEGIMAYDIKAIATMIYTKIKRKQPVTLADIWGSIVTHQFLVDLPGSGHQVYFSDLAPLIKTGRYPLPIFTAVRDHSNPYEWFEFTPFECGSIDKHVWIPTKSFGNRFKDGVSYEDYPEQSLGFMIGISSSAYAANVKEIIRAILSRLAPLFDNKDQRDEFKNIISFLFDEFMDLQVSPPKIHNFAKNMSGISYASKDYLTLIDAGCDFNLPFPPLLRRSINLYIVCDGSNSANVGNKYHPLHGVERYAHDNGYKFPVINYSSIGDEVSVFYDPNDASVPTIIYFPNQLNFSTFKPNYSVEEFNQLYASMRDTVLKHQGLIMEHIARVTNNLIQNRTHHQFKNIFDHLEKN
ncbi:hypothetical protein JST56_07650 [Candidatus Dependentiae bacterium]|nr:hypothetical protein [Candidatus Dependentiae bacterium]